MNIETIPLNRLVPSKANVRKTGASQGIEELAASIEAHGLLQNLQVRPASKGKFEVIAGGRRLAALNILRRQKKLAKDFAVSCAVMTEGDAEEVSLAENVVRLAMHPADQFAAFHGLAEQGKGVEEIAGRFGVTPAVVRQRLKLASVSPVLIALYRDDEINLDQLMAFTVSDDPEAQERVWFAQRYSRSPHAIRAALTAEQVEADDRRVRFVGLDAYLAAGGGMNRDLFQPEHDGYLTDPALLDRLVAAKLETMAADIHAEGWSWVEVMIQRDHAALQGFRRMQPESQPLGEAEQAKRDALSAQYDALIEEHGDEPEGEALDRLNALWAEIDAIDEAAIAWSDEDRAIAGAVLSIDYDGEASIERGLVRPEDARRLKKVEGEGGPVPVEAKGPALSASLTEALTAERTAALRALMVDNQTVALASLCQALALPLFYPYDADQSCIEVKLASRNLRSSADTIETSRAHGLIAERSQAWMERLPMESGDLFGWLLGQDTETLSALLAFCAAQSIDAVQAKTDRPEAPRLVHADALAAALGLDMRAWWQPTKARYLGRVSKAFVLQAVREGVSDQAADNLANLKKEALIEAAERKLDGTGWVPALLRQPVATEAEPEAEAA